MSHPLDDVTKALEGLLLAHEAGPAGSDIDSLLTHAQWKRALAALLVDAIRRAVAAPNGEKREDG